MFGMMVEDIKDSILRMKSMVMENILGLTEGTIKVNG